MSCGFLFFQVSPFGVFYTNVPWPDFMTLNSSVGVIGTPGMLLLIANYPVSVGNLAGEGAFAHVCFIGACAYVCFMKVPE